MRLKMTLAAAALSAGLALAGTTASAAPGSVGGLKADAQAASSVEAVSYGCWWRHGVRYCKRYAAPVYSFYSGPRYYRYGHYRRW